MPSLTALLHTFNDARQLGRALETLYPCDEILIVDHNSRDDTLRIAHEYGARVVPFRGEDAPGLYLQHASFEWILCLEPGESLSETLAASLFEWKSVQSSAPIGAQNVPIREETAHGWNDLPESQTRLIPKNWTEFRGWLPLNNLSLKTLEGSLLRFIATPIGERIGKGSSSPVP
jgi:glycosyltransferase involved in cell wall biosynthesis